MVKILNALIIILVALAGPLAAAEEQRFYDLADSVLKGGTKYTLEEIDDVSQFTEIPLHQRTIVEVSMLGSIEDEARYRTAIAKATDYIESGTIGWAKDYLRMQRGFAYGLLGDGKNGTRDLESTLDAEGLTSINSLDDPSLKIMRKRTPDLALALDSLMKQTVGNYYMDFRKEGRLAKEAFRRFSSIKSQPLRDNCLLQMKNRLGDDEYAKLAESMKSLNSNSHAESSLHMREIGESAVERKENRGLRETTLPLRKGGDKQIPDEPVSSVPFWYLGIGLVLGFVLAILLGRTKKLLR